jgi:hypothetical protein
VAVGAGVSVLKGKTGVSVEVSVELYWGVVAARRGDGDSVTTLEGVKLPGEDALATGLAGGAASV